MREKCFDKKCIKIIILGLYIGFFYFEFRVRVFFIEIIFILIRMYIVYIVYCVVMIYKILILVVWYEIKINSFYLLIGLV